MIIHVYNLRLLRKLCCSEHTLRNDCQITTAQLLASTTICFGFNIYSGKRMATGEMKLIKSETIDLLSQNQESEALEASGELGAGS